jgi:MFS family permease
MPVPARRSWRSSLRYLYRQLYYLTAGGDWALQLPKQIQHNLRWFFFDSVLASASDSGWITYLSLYILALGATPAQIGLMDALASLSAVLLLMPGAMITDRVGKRKPIILIAGGGVSRLALLFLALLPFVIKTPVVIYVFIFLRIIQVGFSNLAMPAWVSMTADVVPLSSRGRYFGTRNLVMGVAAMLAIYLVGQVITRVGGISGYQLAFGLAFLIGMMSTYSYARIKEPKTTHPSQSASSYSLKALLKTFQTDRNFLAFCLYAMLWNFSIMIAGPFFNVFLVRDLKATASIVGFLAVVSSLAGLPAQRFFGRLDDRWKSRKVMLFTGFIIPLIPTVWYFVNASWQAIPINLVGGFIWAGYGLASFNFLLSISPPEQLARYSAIQQISVSIASAMGASVGGLVSTHWGIPIVFLLSGIGRMVASIVFARFVHQPALPAQVSQAIE